MKLAGSEREVDNIGDCGNKCRILECTTPYLSPKSAYRVPYQSLREFPKSVCQYSSIVETEP